MIDTSRASGINQDKSIVIRKIQFLEEQLTSLDHYLPETYEYLMHELDLQKRHLAQLEVQACFEQLDQNHSSI